MDFKTFIDDLSAGYRKVTGQTSSSSLASPGTVADVDAASAAHETRLQAGYEAGHAEGYEDGYAHGYEVGREAGHELGYKKGYDEGFQIGLEAHTPPESQPPPEPKPEHRHRSRNRISWLISRNNEPGLPARGGSTLGAQAHLELAPVNQQSMERLQPVIDLLARSVLTLAVPLLNLSFELLATSGDLLEIIVRELGPFFPDLTRELLPVSLDPMPIHRNFPSA